MKPLKYPGLATRTIPSLFLTIFLTAGGVPTAGFAQDKKANQPSEVKKVKQAETVVTNPVLWADVPDVDVIRIGAYYYMSSTSMHMMPGVPIMRSADLAHWEIVSYVYDTFEDSDAHRLLNNKNIYGKGSWASSLRFHDGVFYVCFASYDANKTYVYRTKDIVKGPWDRSVFSGVYHDPSLLFDDDGRVYMVYCGGAIRIRELTKGATAFREDGVSKTIILTPQKGNIVNAEGSHVYKINGYYYVFLISWPSSGTCRRIEWCYRSRNLLEGYEGRIVMDADLGYHNKGVAQGGIFDTPAGRWYAMLFQDHDAVGRVPVLLPVTWTDDWPVMGVDGKAPETVRVPLPAKKATALTVSDEFNRKKDKLGLTWQWNHNPDNAAWSLTRRPGCLRLTAADTCKNILHARNTLTQRTEGPACTGETLLLTAGMKPGDCAGLAAFQNGYGLIGVLVADDGEKRIVMATNGGAGNPKVIDSVELKQDKAFLKISFDFADSRDMAAFFYSLDGKKWTALGAGLKMKYSLDHFMGYRIALFNYATLTEGGHADFDYFRYTRGR